MNLVQKLLSPNGRTGQRQRGIGFLLLSGFSISIQAVLLVGASILFLSTICGAGLFSRRLHDIGRSGCTQQPWVFVIDLLGVATLMIGGLGSLLTAALTTNHVGWGLLTGGFGLIAPAILAWFFARLVFIIWGSLSRGHANDNHYYPSPVV